jgi:hypothetical protein
LFIVVFENSDFLIPLAAVVVLGRSKVVVAVYRLKCGVSLKESVVPAEFILIKDGFLLKAP